MRVFFACPAAQAAAAEAELGTVPEGGGTFRPLCLLSPRRFEGTGYRGPRKCTPPLARPPQTVRGYLLREEFGYTRHVVTQVTFKGTDWALRLGLGCGNENHSWFVVKNHTPA